MPRALIQAPSLLSVYPCAYPIVTQRKDTCFDHRFGACERIFSIAVIQLRRVTGDLMKGSLASWDLRFANHCDADVVASSKVSMMPFEKISVMRRAAVAPLTFLGLVVRCVCNGLHGE